MITKLIFHIVSGILGLYLAIKFVPGLEFSGQIKTLLIIGGILGLVNFFIRPILHAIAWPLRILTFGLTGLAINMALVWIVANIVFARSLEIAGIVPLFWTTIIIWILNFFFSVYNPRKKKII